MMNLSKLMSLANNPELMTQISKFADIATLIFKNVRLEVLASGKEKVLALLLPYTEENKNRFEAIDNLLDLEGVGELLTVILPDFELIPNFTIEGEKTAYCAVLIPMERKQ